MDCIHIWTYVGPDLGSSLFANAENTDKSVSCHYWVKLHLFLYASLDCFHICTLTSVGGQLHMTLTFDLLLALEDLSITTFLDFFYVQWSQRNFFGCIYTMHLRAFYFQPLE